MLKHNEKIEEKYIKIQKKIYYMIPEKWDKLYLYCSILDTMDNEGKTGELYFYYTPKSILKKNIVNVYEIPTKFNLDEKEYLKLVNELYILIKELRQEMKQDVLADIENWSSMTIVIKNSKFKVEFDYTDLSNDNLDSYKRHIIWRYNYLEIALEKMNKKEKEIINSYLLGAKTLKKKESYEVGVYTQDGETIGYNGKTKYKNEDID